MAHRNIASTLVLALGLFAPSLVDAQATLSVTSTTFREGAAIPLRNSAYGENVSPALSWTGAPAGTRSFAVILRDPDANNFVHWVIYNIPGNATGLPEGVAAGASVTAPASIAGAVQGPMGMRQTNYFGPRPPAGAPHRYIFTVYALDLAPSQAAGLNAAALTTAMEGHILAQGQITGIYQQM